MFAAIRSLSTLPGSVFVTSEDLECRVGSRQQSSSCCICAREVARRAVTRLGYMYHVIYDAVGQRVLKRYERSRAFTSVFVQQSRSDSFNGTK